VLGIGVILLIAGVVLPDGLLIAAGLVLTGIAAQLLDPDRRPPGHAHHRTPH
jgi:acetyltransferase-like isoleucine patch superfamily enzyme